MLKPCVAHGITLIAQVMKVLMTSTLLTLCVGSVRINAVNYYFPIISEYELSILKDNVDTLHDPIRNIIKRIILHCEITKEENETPTRPCVEE